MTALEHAVHRDKAGQKNAVAPSSRHDVLVGRGGSQQEVHHELFHTIAGLCLIYCRSRCTPRAVL